MVGPLAPKGGTVGRNHRFIFPIWGLEDVLPDIDSVVFKNRRLGKLVEEFVFHQLKNTEGISWICDNLQVRDGKVTVGEIDGLYYDHRRVRDGLTTAFGRGQPIARGNTPPGHLAGRPTPVHLEIAYKFYLYDTLEPHDKPLARWIGPNRKDNLFYKLEKLRSKQFALLHNEHTRPYLDAFQLGAKDIEQRVCFKAQLFVPHGGPEVNFGPLNAGCVAGTYLSYRDFDRLKGLRFHIPEKLDWLVVPHLDVEWLDWASAGAAISRQVGEERSPLVWVMDGEGSMGKVFLVFW